MGAAEGCAMRGHGGRVVVARKGGEVAACGGMSERYAVMMRLRHDACRLRGK